MGNFTVKGKSTALKGKLGIPPWDMKRMRSDVLNKAATKRTTGLSRYANKATDMVPTGATGHTNAQQEGVRQGIKKTFNKQKTFGVPGAK